MVDGADVEISGTINNVERVMWHQACGVSNLHDLIVTNSGVNRLLGAYPLHWHLCGDSTRGTVVDNVIIRDSRFRAFVPHGSHGITIRNSGCVDVFGECVWWDPQGTNGGTVDNTNDFTAEGTTASVRWDRADPCCAQFHRISAYMLGSGVGNVIRNSSCTGVVGGGDASCFHWPEHSNDEDNVWVFENNFASGPGHGIFVWQNDSNLHIIDGFVGSISHGAYVNNYLYRNVTAPSLILHAVGRDGELVFEDSHLGAVHVARHVLDGGPVVMRRVTFDSFVVADNAEGIAPAHIFISDTNITCGDVDFANAHPQTTVSIEGVVCSP